jgi:demethylmenaquinone methyltransferase/2-methoxy-6-polyprenyl-1,4-benzoquinol methylase
MSDEISVSQLQGKAEFYDTLSAAYDRFGAKYQFVTSAGVQLLNLPECASVLEIGIGTGRTLEELGRTVGTEGKVFGVDISSRMVALAADRVRQAGLGHVVAQNADAMALPFGDGAFDAAFMSFTLCLFADGQIPRVLAEIKRVLKPGGRLGIVAMNDTGSWALSLVIYRIMHRLFPVFVEKCGRPIDVAQWVTASGYRIVDQRTSKLWGIPIITLVASI